MKNLNKKNANRLTKVEETFDVPEPVAILPLAESDGNYRSGTVNSKSFVGKVLLRIKQKFELTYAL